MAAAILLLSSSVGCGGSVDVSERVDRARVPIVLGHRASEHDLRSTVSLTDVDGVNYCSGALLAPRVVVTAAHCVVLRDANGLVTDALIGADIRVLGGALDTTEPQMGQVDRVDAIVVHPGFPGSGADDAEGLGRHDDLALLLLAEPLLAVMPTPIIGAADAAALDAGKLLTIAGYGATAADGSDADVLYIAETPYRRTNGTELIAGGDGEPDTCGGDSGGPAYLDTPSGMRLLGVASRGIKGSEGRCGSGGIFTSVSAYDAWIVEHSRGLYGTSIAPSNAAQSCQLSWADHRAPARVWPVALLVLAVVRRRAPRPD